ncbi:MAG TPA: hypothetical protein VLA00_02955 [Xanthobacteraceae bacterium]|nr:hypothetical protein [Xanthobacteraceae bacterium]
MTLQNYLLVMPFLVLVLGGAVFLVSWAMTREAREAPATIMTMAAGADVSIWDGAMR